jgi:hypothetical protein
MMKNKIVLLPMLALLILGACQQQKGKQNQENRQVKIEKPATISSQKLPVLQFDETVHDFGKMEQGEIVKYSFHFKNVGEAPLRINRVSTSCGCTVGKYPHEPVKPGEEADIDVTFNSAHKMGYQNKSIMILSNTDPTRMVLRIKAMVVVPRNK